jgi:hypothetical protein
MTRTDPRPLLRYDFEDHGGQTVIDGKPNWPHVLQIDLGREEAFRFCRVLLAQLSDPHEREFYSIALCGEMSGPEVEE